MSTHGCIGIPCTLCGPVRSADGVMKALAGSERNDVEAALRYGDVVSALSGYRGEDESADDAIARLRSDAESRIAAAVAAEREACALVATDVSAAPSAFVIRDAIRARGGKS